MENVGAIIDKSQLLYIKNQFKQVLQEKEISKNFLNEITIIAAALIINIDHFQIATNQTIKELTVGSKQFDIINTAYELFEKVSQEEIQAILEGLLIEFRMRQRNQFLIN